MKRIVASYVICAALATAMAQHPVIPRDSDIEAKVANTLASMSLDEKIGQMVQLEVGMITYRYPQYSAEAFMP